MAGTTPNYEIDYNDERFTKVEKDYQQDMTETQHLYDGMIGQSDKFYQDQVNALEDWEKEQINIQNKQTNFAIEKIEQEKKKAETDYIKEQSGAYVDWQKQSNPYGVEAEKMASAGLTNTGFAESSQVAMYNQYQNRVATARQTFEYIVMDYNNSIKEAQLQNDAILAEIAFQTNQQQLQLLLDGFNQNLELVLRKADKITELKNNKWQKELAILDQMNTENALKEQIREFDTRLEFDAEQNQLDRKHQEYLTKLDQDFKAQQNNIDRQLQRDLAKEDQEFKIKLAGIEDKYARERAKQEHEYKIKEINAEYAAKRQNAKYEYDLAKQSAILGGGSSSSSAKAKSGSPKTVMPSISENAKNKKTWENGTYTFETAMAYLKKKGATAGVKTRHEWSRSPSSADYKNNATYEDYLKAYVRWQTNGK